MLGLYQNMRFHCRQKLIMMAPQTREMELT